MKKILFLLLALSVFSCRKESDILKPKHEASHLRTVSDSTADAYFLRCSNAGYSTDSARKYLITNLIIRLKNEVGIDGTTSQFNSLDVLYLFPEHKQVAGFNVLQDKFNGTLTVDLLPTTSHVYGKGFQGKTGKLLLNTNFNPFDGLNTYNFTRNNNAFGCYSNTNKREVCALISNLDGSTNGYELKTHTNGIIAINGNTIGLLTNAVDCSGGFSSKRTTSTFANVFKNSKGDNGNTTATSATVNKTFKMFQRDLNGVYSLGTNNRIAFAYFGSANIDVQKLERAIIEEYLKPIGGAITKLLVLDGNSFISNYDISVKLIDKLWLNGVECTTLYNGVTGINIGTMITNLPTKIAPYKESYFDKEAYIFWEISNTLKGTGTVADTYLKMHNYIAQAKGYGFQNMCINTCLPFKTLTPSKRKNVSDLNDTTTLNGLIRLRYNAYLGADYFVDCGSESPIFDDSFGVAGVGEKNTTYFNADEQHLNTTGDTYLVNNYLYPEIYNILH